MRVANLESNEPQFFLKMSPMGRSFSYKLAWQLDKNTTNFLVTL